MSPSYFLFLSFFLSSDDTEVRICVDNVDKEGRTAIHRTIKSKYSNVDSLFKEDNGKKFIVVRKKKGMRLRWRRRREGVRRRLMKGEGEGRVGGEE